MIKKNLKLMITLAFLLVIVGTATYAYFANTVTYQYDLGMDVATANGTYIFTAYPEDSINMAINVADTFPKSDNGNIVVELLSLAGGEKVTCSYDVEWVWDSTDKYTKSDVTLPYTNNGTTYNYEFSIKEKSYLAETDLSKFSWSNNRATLISGLTISSSSSTNATKQVLQFQNTIYDLGIHQTNLLGKSFASHLEVTNVDCNFNQLDAYAFYSEDDNSLNFVRAESEPNGTYNDKTVSAVYADIESYEGAPWYEDGISSEITSVVFEDTIRPINTASWFAEMTELTTLNLEKLNTMYVTDMSEMFFNTGTNSESFTLNLGDNFYTSNVISMYYMFAGLASSATDFTLDLGEHFDTSKVEDMTSMFENTGNSSTNLTLNLGDHFDTSNVYGMAYMFYGVGYSNPSFVLDVSSFTVGGGLSLESFAQEGARTIKMGPGWQNADFEYMNSFFAYGDETPLTLINAPDIFKEYPFDYDARTVTFIYE